MSIVLKHLGQEDPRHLPHRFNRPSKIQSVWWQRMHSGRLKVFASLSKYLDERRLDRRDERDQIVKDHDHLQRCLVSSVSWMRTKPTTCSGGSLPHLPRVMRLDEVTFYPDRALIRGSDVS